MWLLQLLLRPLRSLNWSNWTHRMQTMNHIHCCCTIGGAVAEHSVAVVEVEAAAVVVDNKQDWWHAAAVDDAIDDDDLDTVENQNNTNVDACRDYCWEDFGGDVGRYGYARHSSFLPLLLLPSWSADEADRLDLNYFDDVKC